MALSLRPIDVYPITVRKLRVIRTAEVTPGMRRVTLGGPGLQAHTAPNGRDVAAFRSDGFDDEFKLILRHPDLDEALLPEQGDGRLIWPRDPKLVMRTYTVRRWDPASAEIDVDFVRHGIGMATTWAERVQVGEEVHIAGPKSSGGHPDADWTLVVGDETALPAIGRWLENWPQGARGQVFIEVEEESHQQELPAPDGVSVTWLLRGDGGPCETLLPALREAPWWPGTVFAWVAGEAVALTQIRRWLRGEKGLGRENIEVTGYWRRRKVTPHSADSAVPEEDEGALHDELDQLADLVPAFALRTAVELGLPKALGEEAKNADDLATKLGADAVGVAKLCTFLASIGILRTHNGDSTYSLSILGRELLDDHAADELVGAAARAQLTALLGLSEAIRSGQSVEVGIDKQTRRFRIEDGEELAGYFASSLASLPHMPQVGTFALMGVGAGAIAEALVRTHTQVNVQIIASLEDIELLKEMHMVHPRITYLPGSVVALESLARAYPWETTFLYGVLADMPRTDALHALRGTPGQHLFVFEDLAQEGEEAEESGEALVDFAMGRGGHRSDAELRALFAEAGLRVIERSNVGWGAMLYQLER
ncbi:MAG: siderophore-interacting protein [Actinomycetaceae bacterium]|nr:siderophore-interacting protein [Actinomycetaceae bacterium]